MTFETSIFLNIMDFKKSIPIRTKTLEKELVRNSIQILCSEQMFFFHSFIFHNKCVDYVYKTIRYCNFMLSCIVNAIIKINRQDHFVFCQVFDSSHFVFVTRSFVLHFLRWITIVFRHVRCSSSLKIPTQECEHPSTRRYLMLDSNVCL